MVTGIRDIITRLIDNKLAELAYYDHDVDNQYFGDAISTQYQLPDYDPRLHTTYEPCLLFAGSGDYAGSTIDMANRRYVEENYPELFECGSIMYRSLGYGYTCLVIFFLRPSVARSGLIDDFDSLPDYCLFDDEIEAATQEELLDEAWDNWLSDDFEHKLEKLTGIEFTETNWQSALFWQMLRYGDGSEYYPEVGESIYVDLEAVFRDSDMLIATIQKHADDLETGEFELDAEYRYVGYELLLDWTYEGSADYNERIMVRNLHKHQKVDSIPNTILSEFGLKWTGKQGLFWEVKLINKPLRDALKSGITNIAPIWPIDCYCINCHDHAVMRVYHGNNLYCNVCSKCYNKLMDYWPKCQHCHAKNANASLQLPLLADTEDDTTLTHCRECKDMFMGTF